MTCLVPSARVIVPTVALTPWTVGLSPVVVTAGQSPEQPVLQALLPEFLVSLSNA